MGKGRYLIVAVAILVSSLPVCGCRAATAAGGPGQLQGTIAISGAWALYPLMVRWGEEFQKANPGVRFDISAGGAGKGMADALSGAVEIGMVSRDIAPEEEARGAFWVPVAKDAVLPTANAQNPVLEELMSRGVSREVFAGIFIGGEIVRWDQVVGQPEALEGIHVYTRSDSAGAPETWALYLGGRQEDLLGIGIYGDPGILDAVIKDPLGIGYNNLNYAYDATTGLPVKGAVVLPVDANGNGLADPEEVLDTKAKAVAAVASGRYPSPPARALFLVTHGKPEGLTRAFLLWILGDGQQYVESTGYVRLDAGALQEAAAGLQ